MFNIPEAEERSASSITDDFSRLDPKISFGVEYHWSLLVIYRKVSCPAYISKRII